MANGGEIVTDLTVGEQAMTQMSDRQALFFSGMISYRAVQRDYAEAPENIAHLGSKDTFNSDFFF